MVVLVTTSSVVGSGDCSPGPDAVLTACIVVVCMDIVVVDVDFHGVGVEVALDVDVHGAGAVVVLVVDLHGAGVEVVLVADVHGAGVEVVVEVTTSSVT